jgi:hypothetical protein
MISAPKEIARKYASFSVSLFDMKISGFASVTKHLLRSASLLTAVLWLNWFGAPAQSAPTQTTTPEVPDWALPSSATHKQYPPPADFHRPSKNFDTPIGIFDGQSDIGGPLVAGNASYDQGTKSYTINSAGYNIWYTRDEFRYLWKKMSGDVSFAADVSFPVAQTPPHDRKVVLVIRQDLEDNSKEIMVAEHGSGMVHLAQRPEKNEVMKDMQYRIGGAMLTGVMPKRIGIEKHGDSFALFISVQGEPMHQFGPPIELHVDGPFYVGIGFCSHYPVTVDTGEFSKITLDNSAGKMN